jgi:hypothetical protein
LVDQDIKAAALSSTVHLAVNLHLIKRRDKCPVSSRFAFEVRVSRWRLRARDVYLKPPVLLTVPAFDSSDVSVGSSGGPRTGANTTPSGSLRL